MKGSNFSFNGQSIYVGIDVHKTTWSVAIFGPGSYRKQFSQKSSAEILFKHLNEKYKGATYYSVYESGFTGFSTHYALTKLGIKNIIVNASDVPGTQKEQIHKTDKVDAMRLGQALRDQRLKGIYILSPEEIEFREQVRYRSVLVKENSRWKNRIKSYLNRYGIDYPESFASKGSHWSNRFVEWLRELSTASHSSLLPLVNSYVQQRENLARYNKFLRKLVKETKESAELMELLISIPGIGFCTSVVFLSEIGNVDRFKSEKDFASFIGIIPTSHDSGDKKSPGEMTFRKNKHLSRLLIESAWVAIRVDSALSACFGKLCRRMTQTNAIIRIARKLSNRILSVLKRKEKYTYEYNGQK